MKNEIIKDTDNYNEKKLNNYHLPIIKCVNQLLDMIEFSKEDEQKFLFSHNRSKYLYHEIYIPKRNKKELRKIEVPHPKIKAIQQIINKYILSRFKMPFPCNGFVKERSILTNAIPHVSAKSLLKFDIKDFFPSINLQMVVKQFRFFGYGINVSRYLGYLCVDKNFQLPQGAPTSPSLSNLICIKIDKRIEGFCKRYGYNYTRYADDITISSLSYISKEQYYKIKEFVSMVLDDKDELYSFKLNEEKCHYFNSGQRLIVTGLVVNSKISVCKSICRNLENAIRYINLFGVRSHLKHLNQDLDIYEYKQYLFGMAYFVKMVNKELGTKYVLDLQKLDFNCKEDNYCE